MFITELTKRDWYRIYKYLWLSNCPITYKFIQNLIKTGLLIIALLGIYIIPSSIFLEHEPLLKIFLETAFFVSFPILYYPYIWWVLTLRFSPTVWVTFFDSPDEELSKQLAKKYPKCRRPNMQNFFSLPNNSKWVVLEFKDYYIFYLKNSKKFGYTISIIKRADIKDESDFLAKIAPVCGRKVEYPTVNLHVKN